MKNQTWLSCKMLKNNLWKVRERDDQDLSLNLYLGRTIKCSSISAGDWYPYRNVFQCLITFSIWERRFPLFNLNLPYYSSYLLPFFFVFYEHEERFSLFITTFSLFEGSFHVPQLPQYFPPSFLPYFSMDRCRVAVITDWLTWDGKGGILASLEGSSDKERNIHRWN